MPEHKIAPDVRDFLRKHIRTVEQLEILLLLRQEKYREWTVPEVFAKVRSSEQSVAMRLAQFAEEGMLSASNGVPVTYRYSPRQSNLDDVIGRTGEAFQTRRVQVMETIFGGGDTDIVDPIQSFADAFRFRAKPPENRG
ncbi:MAG: hypothetical protein EOP84_22955 [Verrucomicrobiaceae bacterium]|nr:MAG: hypothetical protein EOP84_22955 [Verrucomicrobiaceae bacterium]